jgi:response regulator RpfG family c-di-GMP phosphodiesterase
VRILIRAKDLSDISVISMLVSLEHHINYDGTGYPGLSKKRTPNIFSRIISIADCYDMLTSGMGYKRTAYNPENALKFMHGKSGALFDPVFMRVFIKMLSGDNPALQ